MITYLVVALVLLQLVQTYFVVTYSRPIEAAPVDTPKEEPNALLLAYVDKSIEGLNVQLAGYVDQSIDRVDELEELFINWSKQSNARVSGVQELSNDILEVVGGISDRVEYLEDSLSFKTEPEAPVYLSQPPAPEVPVEIEDTIVDIVEETPEEPVQEVPEHRAVAHHSPQEDPAAKRARLKAEGRAKAEAAAPSPEDVAPIKPERSEDDPMITDLRAEPFKVEPETLDGVYDIPALTGDYEIMGQPGQRAPRARGFRRI